MDALFQLLTQFDITELGISSQWLLLGAIAIATSLLVIAIGLIIIGSKDPLKKRLEEVSAQELHNRKRSHKLENTLESLSPVFTPSSSKERESVSVKLMNAGFHQKNALSIYYAIKTLTGVVGVIIAVALYFYMSEFKYTNILILLSVAVGLFLPNLILERYIGKRKERMRSAVPDALDLLVVCTESGLGFNAAMQRVANELTVSHPDFADELDTVCVKIQAGVTIKDAFNELIRRTGLHEITGLVKMLNHASRVGGSLAKTLRDYNEDYRDRRQQEAEEVAAKIPTKMLFPMILLIWPCFFIVAIGPALITIFTTL
ncbi:pilus assembly protein TadC [Vibrio sp. MACH09]|uniref:type II secretion system F family protein n=1 Tax=unclassified Vibrio TaxID=2614977 RepID=UPI0014937951|nr:MULTISPECIES: type II secretion system F family protein [unclassified Vibrio]NOI64867.1 type II secretion system F family protein [Vibrio sp. 99-8-1]GLO61704.1 pilus assembly protein TadC [Vibrio sp. MACH09]